jgi:hypothetical protein
MFNANNRGNTGDIATGPEFHNLASVVAPHVKLKFDTGILVIFAVFQGAMLLFLWLAWIWTVFHAASLPAISSFPLFDFSFKTDLPRLPASPEEVIGAGDSEVLRLIDGRKVMFRNSFNH